MQYRSRFPVSISQAYLREQQRLHESPKYGVASTGYAPIISQIINNYKLQSLSDYGAGKCRLIKALKEAGHNDLSYFPYDPVFPDYGPPTPADLVCCIDVLEHIEPIHLDSVLDQLQSLTNKYAFFTIHTGPAVKVLQDGRNAHIIQAPTSWWLPLLSKRFEIHTLKSTKAGFWILATPKNYSLSINSR